MKSILVYQEYSKARHWPGKEKCGKYDPEHKAKVQEILASSSQCTGQEDDVFVEPQETQELEESHMMQFHVNVNQERTD